MFYAGIDADQFPGLGMMWSLKTATDAEFCAIYLVAPSHPNAGWTGQRAALDAMGWGFAPVYVGQEIVGPGAHHASAAQGALDGADAAAKMSAEGFAVGSCVYLDLENGPPFAPPMSDYVKAWVSAVASAGWLPGVYCSHMMADEIADQTSARIWAFKVATTAQSEGYGPFGAPDPAGSGSNCATIWQHADNVKVAPFGVLVDLDTSSMADPSAPS